MALLNRRAGNFIRFFRLYSMDIDDFLHVTPADVDPGSGRLLLADPRMVDPSFYRSAVLILDREDTGGHLGLVLNREIGVNVSALFDDWPGTEKMPLFNGGPVELERLFMLHRLGDAIDGCFEIMPGIYAGGDAAQIRDYIASGAETDGVIRFFMGYSGWASGQLTKEILENSWTVNVDPDPRELLLGSGDDYWRREVLRLGPDYRFWPNIPAHPSLN